MTHHNILLFHCLYFLNICYAIGHTDDSVHKITFPLFDTLRKDLDVHKHELKLNRNHMLKECNY